MDRPSPLGWAPRQPTRMRMLLLLFSSIDTAASSPSAGVKHESLLLEGASCADRETLALTRQCDELRHAEKVFVLGGPKTGTTTLTTILRRLLGPSPDEPAECCHQCAIVWHRQQQLDPFKDYSCFLDNGDLADFAKLERTFPNARFILNTRDLQSWGAFHFICILCILCMLHLARINPSSHPLPHCTTITNRNWVVHCRHFYPSAHQLPPRAGKLHRRGGRG